MKTDLTDLVLDIQVLLDNKLQRTELVLEILRSLWRSIPFCQNVFSPRQSLVALRLGGAPLINFSFTSPQAFYSPPSSKLQAFDNSKRNLKYLEVSFLLL